MIGTVVAKSRRLLGAVFFLAVGLVVTGCGGGSNNTVSGKVTYTDKDGKVNIVKGGDVVFHGDKRWTGSSPISEDGSYMVGKVPVGKVKITVDNKSLKPNEMAKKMPKPPEGQGPPPGVKTFYETGGNPERYIELPEKYAKKESSGLTFDVQSGKNQHDIELK